MFTNKSIELYKQLLEIASPIKDEYLKNCPVFDNQLLFWDINAICYQKMYEEIPSKDKIIETKVLIDEIPWLKDLYKKSHDFYLKKRNNSIKWLDVQLWKQFEDVFIKFLNNLWINAMRWDLKNRKLPDIMVLDKTRNIKAHIELKYHNAPFILSKKLINRETYEGSITLDFDKVQRQLVEIRSELDRPTFYVHWVDFPDLKWIFFNTHEQIDAYLNSDNLETFDRETREWDYCLTKKIWYTKKFYPPLHEMWDFEELIDILQN